ncbi:MAG TPA: fatty acid desaturase [Pseudonocardiaceae bacterium]|nr:fatty acid desaturase [Pseudonocardiaceae bacterium]
MAFVTVGLPTFGFIAAIVFAAHYGFTAADGVLLGVLYLVTIVGVEAGLHRFFSHRSFTAGPAVTTLLALFGGMAAQGPIIFWVAIHRTHHAFTDADGDPHSPRPLGDGRFARLRGLWHGHVGWLFTLRRSNWSAYVPDLLKDRLVMRLNQAYFAFVLFGLALPTLLGWLVDGGWRGAVGGLLWGGLARIFVLDHVTWGINSIAHTFGSRPHRTRDNSRNVAVLAPVSVGGSWHNNHHDSPAYADNRIRFWQVDLAGLFIRLLDKAGLIGNVRYRTH